MDVRCLNCGMLFDDAERDTRCPHSRFLSVEDQARKVAALALVAEGASVCFNHQPSGPSHRIMSIGYRGMLTLDDMVGEFAPHLFRKGPPL